MRILFVSQRVPYPPNRGDKIATYNEVRHLTRNHEVSIACLADGESDVANVSALRALAVSVDAVVLRRQTAYVRALASLFTGRPFTVAYFNEPELHRIVAARVQEKKFDAIIIFSSGMAQFAESYSGVPRIMQFGDLDSLKWHQYANKARFPLSWLYGREERLLMEYERHIARTFSHSVVFTPVEFEDFRRLIPGASVSCVSNGVDLDYFRAQGGNKKSNELVFTGVMDYFPNVEGVIWFCEEVLPLIHREIPDVSFTICGARPHAKVQRLTRFSGVTVTGPVPDVRPYLEQASVCVVPLRIARGIQNKLIEAMAMSLPTVTCSAAFRGVEAIAGKDLEVADDPHSFAAATVRLLRNEDLRLEMGHAARVCVETHYRWDQQLERLDRVLAQVTSSNCSVV